MAQLLFIDNNYEAYTVSLIVLESLGPQDLHLDLYMNSRMLSEEMQINFF